MPTDVIVLLFFSFYFVIQNPGVLRGDLFGAADLAKYYFPWIVAFEPNYPNRSYLSWSDQMDQSLPPINFIRESILNWDLPLYSNFSQNGIPYLFVVQHEAMSPLLTLLSIPLGSVIGITLYVFIKYMIGSFFFFKLMLQFKLKASSAFIGATIFSFGSFATANLQGPIGTLYFLMPLYVFLIKNFFELQSWKYAISLPIVILWLFTAGYVPALAYIVMFTLFFIFFNFYSVKINKKFILKMLYVIAVSALILGPYLFDTARYLLYSVDLGYRAEKWNYALDLGKSATYFFPWFYGEQGFLRTSTYFGLISIVFIYLGLVAKSTNRELNTFKLYATFLFLILYFEGFRTLFYQHIPLANLSNADNQLIIYGFVLAVLASFGFDDLINNKINLKKLLPIFIFIIMCGLYFITISEGNVGRRSILRFFIIIGMALVILVLAFFIQKGKLSQEILGTLLILIFTVHILDLYSFARNYTWTVESRYVYPETPLITFLKQNQGENKIVAMGVNLIPDSYLWHGLRVVGGRGFFPNQINNLYKDIDKNIEDQPPTQKFFYSESFDFENSLLSLMGVRFIVSAPENVQQSGIDLITSNFVRKVYADSDGVVYEVPTEADSYTVFEKNKYLEQNFDLPVSELDILNSTQYEIKIHSSKNIYKKLSFNSETENVLVLGDNFDPYWKVTINEIPAEVSRAAGYFMSVVIPPGENLVEFRYRPPSFYLAIISLSVFFLSFFIILIYKIGSGKRI